MKQIRLHITKAVAAAFLVAGLFACNEDKGNYDYSEIGVVASFSRIDNSYTRVLTDSLIIRPGVAFDTLQYPEVNEADFTYTWKIEQGSGDNGALKLLHEGRNLEIVIDTPIFQINRSYKLVYEVVNKTTNIPYRKIFTVTTENLFQRGFVALSQKTDGLELDVVSFYRNKFTLYTDVLESMDSELPRNATPWDIVTYDDRLAPDPMHIETDYSLFILTDQYTTRLMPTNYSWKPSYDISNIIEKDSYLDTAFVQKGKPVIAKQLRYSYIQSASIMQPRVLMYHQESAEEANWYLYITFPQYSANAVQMNRFRDVSNNGALNGAVRYNAAPFVSMTRFNLMYYNMDNNVFVSGSLPVTDGQGGDFGTRKFYYADAFVRPGGIGENPGSAGFKFTDDMTGLLYMDDQQGSGLYHLANYAIRKLPDGTLQYIQWNVNNTANGQTTTALMNNTKQRSSKFATNSRVVDAKFFARPPLANNMWLYYVTNDNRVYKANIGSANVAEEDITDTFVKDGYNEITVFKYTRPESNSVPDVANALAVATYNATNGLDSGGKVEFFLPVSGVDNGNLEVAKYPKPLDEDDVYQTMSFTGLGKVAGLTYKKR
ncbi:MAG: hypothetical protein LBR65_09350 [Culturomica sp.]|nr:hypothetical protein [Culturomica sp.]